MFTFKGKDLRCNLESVMEIHNPHFYWKVGTQDHTMLEELFRTWNIDDFFPQVMT